MLAWIAARFSSLRTWLLVRLGLWRGQWRRGQVTVPAARFYVGVFANDSWSYGLYTPAGLRDDVAAPLVVVLHGCRQRALNFAQASGWTRTADLNRLRLLCPDQRRRANLYRCWNWFHPLAQRGEGELLALLAMIDEVVARRAVTRVVAVGLSAGAAMASLLAFHRPARIAAAVAVASPPLLGALNMQNPRDVMRRGLLLDPVRALGSGIAACAPLAIVHGGTDEVVARVCADQLLAQALESQRRAEVTLAEQPPQMRIGARYVDYLADGRPRLRFVDVPGLGHLWTGGPGGHAYCEPNGVALTALSMEFFRSSGALDP